MKRLEARIYERIDTEFPKHASEGEGQMRLSYLTAQNFHGMDINPFAVEIAKVTMMIARKLAIDELHIAEQALPLDNLDANFRAVDALVQRGTLQSGMGVPPMNSAGHGQDAQATRTPWPQADVIIGNPPFIGAKLLVLAAYGFAAEKRGAATDLLAQLLALNQQVAAKLERAEPVTAPGIPAGFPRPESLLTEDCIRPVG
jgi:hypothetical protein